MQKDLSILSINIGHGMLLDDLLVYVKSKMDSVPVFCFQEADGAARPLLDALLLSKYTASDAEKDAGVEFFSLATYVRRDYAVNETKTVLANLAGAGLALISTIEIAPEAYVSVVNVHGHPRPGHKLDTPVRIAQSQAIIKSTTANDCMNVIVGDFNLLPNTLSIEMFAQNGYKNLIDEFNIPTTRNEIAWRKYPNNKQLFADYAFVQDDDSLRYDFAVEDVDVSDHLPLLLTVGVTIPTVSIAARSLPASV